MSHSEAILEARATQMQGITQLYNYIPSCNNPLCITLHVSSERILVHGDNQVNRNSILRPDAWNHSPEVSSQTYRKGSNNQM